MRVWAKPSLQLESGSLNAMRGAKCRVILTPTSTVTMSKPSSLKVFVIMVLSLVLLWAGVAVLIGVFALLVKLFSLS
jgi:hypothetical protein